MAVQERQRRGRVAKLVDLVEPKWDEGPVSPCCRESLVALARLLARQAAREVFERARSADAACRPEPGDR